MRSANDHLLNLVACAAYVEAVGGLSHTDTLQVEVFNHAILLSLDIGDAGGDKGIFDSD